MLVAVLLCCLDWILIENEDVHCPPIVSRIDESRSMIDMQTMQSDMLVSIFASIFPFLSIDEKMKEANVKRNRNTAVRLDTVVIPQLLDDSDLFHLRFDDAIEF